MDINRVKKLHRLELKTPKTPQRIIIVLKTIQHLLIYNSKYSNDLFISRCFLGRMIYPTHFSASGPCHFKNIDRAEFSLTSQANIS